MMVQTENHQDPHNIEELKQLIDNEDYLRAAITRIAQVLSDELLELSNFGEPHER